ncbi:MAG: hypothetical protein A3D65_05285 [Candidatus Lloydbacteria bacterium RIFCSPHIGHO2_02_FULL_50_13]|uniref:Uncharacterized protein n=1 Tax=Candidatus Lloydbacteria bacterium RIFCSPHIGHO2_02_FULL_50_13 TaxID=1798661 RepID=A0A1G2D8B2_9BACT|nr:MAG: hypothetical protein A3D65_05285 [Candidatus Lloydbacteria bacterium RIFCSPHIGHO2_02_FULL_50_13]
MAKRDGYFLKQERLHEVVLAAIDENGGRFLSDLAGVLSGRKIEMSKKEVTAALTTAAKDGRLLLQFRFNGTRPDLFVRAKHYPAVTGQAHRGCNDPVCDDCHPEFFS